MMKQGKFTYSPVSKAFERTNKTIEDQGEKQIKALEENGKQLVNSSAENDSLILLKQKEIFNELLNQRMDEIVSLINKLILFSYLLS